MENKKTNKIKITINGQDLEFPMDMSVLQGFMQQAGQQATKQLSSEQVASTARQALGLPMPFQSSHRRLEDDFFSLIHGDMNTLRGFGMFNRDERVSRALIALHNRLRRLEEMCFAPEKPVAEKRVSKQVSEKAKPRSAAKKPVKKSRKNLGKK